MAARDQDRAAFPTREDRIDQYDSLSLFVADDHLVKPLPVGRDEPGKDPRIDVHVEGSHVAGAVTHTNKE